MLRLIPFELGKIWRKRGFLLAVCALLLAHLFLLWYTSLPGEGEPPLSAYKKLQAELSGKTEGEKGALIGEWKEMVDGVCFVRDILGMQSFQNEMGSILAKQEMEAHPGLFERYNKLYQSGSYLSFTGSLEQEQAFAEEIYEEWQTVSGYGAYLRSIQENKEALSGISVFGGQSGESYSLRNLKRSAEDYAGLDGGKIRFIPSRGIVSAMESAWTDLLLVLGVLLLVGSLITGEKEKRLFFVTRSTKYGILHSIGAKLAALCVSCLFLTGLFYTVSLVFFGQNAGWFDPGAALQSVSVYTQSSLPVSVSWYLVFSVLTKALALFGVGTVLTVFSIRSDIAALPFLAGAGIIGGSALLYYLIPAGSVYSVFKYINPVGLMKTEHLYGGYLNFNLFGYPVSRRELSLALIVLTGTAGVLGSLLSFGRLRSFEAKKLRISVPLPFRPHTSLFRHESYKLLVTNRGLPVLLLFTALLAYRSLARTYTPSVGEQYYQSMMAELEGSLTDEKERLILSEKARYEEAFRALSQIERMAEAGEINEEAAERIRAQADMTLAFYPAFRRVETQYERIRAEGGRFVYDTGYLYLFGILEDAFSVDLLILSVGIVLVMSGLLSMEYQTGALFLIGASRAGKRKVLCCKALAGGLAAAALALVPVLCRIYRISSAYPMQSLGAAIQNIPQFGKAAVPMSIFCFLLIFVLSQVLAAVLLAWLTMAVSIWRKNQVQTVFFALLFFAVPMLLKLLDFEPAKWFSLYPLYGWTFLRGKVPGSGLGI